MQGAESSVKPKKQRRAMFNAANHERHKYFSAHLSAELRALHHTRALPIRKGDTVRIMRGDHKGFEGKVSRVDRKKYRVYAEGLTREKVDGTTISVPTHPSKTMLINLNVEDKWRKQILERKKETKAAERVTEKPETEDLAESEAPTKEPAPKKRRRKRTAAKPAEKKAEIEAIKPKKVKTSRKRQASKALAPASEKKRPAKRRRAKKPKEER